PGRFLSAANLRIVLAQTVIVAIGAIGMTIIIVSGGIDLSPGSTIALTGVTCALALRGGGPPFAAPAAEGARGWNGASGKRPGYHYRARGSLHRHPRHAGHRTRRGQMAFRRADGQRSSDLAQQSGGGVSQPFLVAGCARSLAGGGAGDVGLHH